MNKDKNITPENNKGQQHGLWELYYNDGELMFKSFYHNGKLVGNEEYYSYNGILSRKRYNI